MQGRIGKFSVTCPIKPYTANKIIPQKNKTKQKQKQTIAVDMSLTKKEYFPK